MFMRYLSSRDVDFAYWAINGIKYSEGFNGADGAEPSESLERKLCNLQAVSIQIEAEELVSLRGDMLRGVWYCLTTVAVINALDALSDINELKALDADGECSRDAASACSLNLIQVESQEADKRTWEWRVTAAGGRQLKAVEQWDFEPTAWGDISHFGRFTGGTCTFFGCDQTRGPTLCHHFKCICAEGYLAFAGSAHQMTSLPSPARCDRCVGLLHSAPGVDGVAEPAVRSRLKALCTRRGAVRSGNAKMPQCRKPCEVFTVHYQEDTSVTCPSVVLTSEGSDQISKIRASKAVLSSVVCAEAMAHLGPGRPWDPDRRTVACQHLSGAWLQRHSDHQMKRLLTQRGSAKSVRRHGGQLRSASQDVDLTLRLKGFGDKSYEDAPTEEPPPYYDLHTRNGFDADHNEEDEDFVPYQVFDIVRLRSKPSVGVQPMKASGGATGEFAVVPVTNASRSEAGTFAGAKQEQGQLEVVGRVQNLSK
eukprot:s24_g39.t2